jgi:hypothetical protein
VHDWRRWHDDYLDPSSELSQRLAVVQQAIREWADALPAGPARLLSICACQGHDVLGALADHPRRGDITGVLVELDLDNVAAANEALAAAGLTGVRARVGDAGHTSSYDAAVPANLVLACGVFGNIPDDDVQRTVAALSGLCDADATVIWTRHRRAPDLTPTIRGWLADAGFEEVAFCSPGPDRYAVGIARLTGPPRALGDDRRLFAFTR